MIARLLKAIRDFFTIPELAPDDEDGFSDSEREELEVIRDHEERR